ncbi:MAG: ATP-dependent helicase, partial [Desulfovibrio sp.]|nr:ATP-dependent helicase [Desulfovibrio sp.]
LLNQGLGDIQGGTFHSFGFHLLKIYHPAWLGERSFSLLDATDALNAIKHCQNMLGLGSKDRSFPKTQTIQALISKARNKEQSLTATIEQDSFQLTGYAEAITSIAEAYQTYRREQGLLDYDDLLFELEDLLQNNPYAAASIRRKYQYIMVDEYQDTNLVQARIVQLLADQKNPESSSQIMAVGDEAQSIYSFRGANVRNILDFPKYFPKARIIRLEENYRSTQAVLDVANTLLQNATESFDKKLYTRQEGGLPVSIVEPLDDDEQARLVAKQISKLLDLYPPEEIAVLFRSGFHSYHVEANLNRLGIPFRKYGGLRYTEAAHIKDCLAFARLIVNPIDFPAFSRLASMHPGIGPKTVERMSAYIRAGDETNLNKAIAKNKSFAADMAFVDDLRTKTNKPNAIISAIVDYFRPRLEQNFPDDWPQRQQGLEEMINIASNYDSLEDFIADLVLDAQIEAQDEDRGKIILSTVHSAKGLEWDAVLIIDLVENRFPSKHALANEQAYEEERRLMYVACTRARKELFLFVPKTIYNRFEHWKEPTTPSPFVSELTHLPANTLKQGLSRKKSTGKKGKTAKEPSQGTSCQHAIFGHGKIVSVIDESTLTVQFDLYGQKTIRKEFLDLED